MASLGFPKTRFTDCGFDADVFNEELTGYAQSAGIVSAAKGRSLRTYFMGMKSSVGGQEVKRNLARSISELERA